MAGRDATEDGLPLKHGEFLVLAVLRGAPLHGYGIVQAVAERTSQKVKLRPGNLYRVLDRMMERGLIEPGERRPARELDDERRTYYRITPLGRKVLAAEAELLASVAADVIASPGKA